MTNVAHVNILSAIGCDKVAVGEANKQMEVTDPMLKYAFLILCRKCKVN
jgi:hypothetical protein